MRSPLSAAVLGLALLSPLPSTSAHALTLIEARKLLAPDAAACDRFGHSVALDGDTAIVGAGRLFDRNDGRFGPESAYVFDLAPDGDEDGVGDDVDNCPAHYNPRQEDLDDSGTGDACDPDIDGDSVADEADACFGTVLDVERQGARKNRFRVGTDGEFVDAEGTAAGITIADTGGCSGDQIIAAAGLGGGGHERFGLSRSALEDWIASLP